MRKKSSCAIYLAMPNISKEYGIDLSLTCGEELDV